MECLLQIWPFDTRTLGHDEAAHWVGGEGLTLGQILLCQIKAIDFPGVNTGCRFAAA
ncbi:hypothetical protein SAMN05192589_110160 [Paracidovorax valerianellae]|uniref:Uncharacterized protein n=1 Tax=Paracidovorax valerianellae TaxID=187868 RepID=A0A1G6YU98_9BURK|nr:hypothetical protein SAMN05192589_110160 [Paracidovorax valerianellae]